MGRDGTDSAEHAETARQLYPRFREIAASAIYAELALPSGPARRPYVVTNMVSTVDGVVAIGGRSGSLGSRLDRALMRRIRAATDAVLTGAASVRAEPIDPGVPADLARARERRGLPEQPLAVTVSRTLDLDPRNSFFRHGPCRCLVFTGRATPPDRVSAMRAWAYVEQVDGDDVDVGQMVAVLRERYGVERLLVEGGPTLVRALLDRGLIDEMFWTVAPKLAGGRGETMVGGAAVDGVRARLRLVSLFEHRSELFARYRLVEAKI
jgi:riboflavin-specific deaminase-like protein